MQLLGTRENCALIIFIKNPIPGRVKTRIAKTTGPEKALEIYERLLDYTRKTSLISNCRRFLYYSDFIDIDDAWSPDAFEKRLQSEGNLGEKITTAFKEVAAYYEKTVIIGSDCAELTNGHIELALNHLDKHDAVIGPTYDGGYYLLALKRLEPALFQNINWSTKSVFQETVGKFDSVNFAYSVLPKLHDVDLEEDWKNLGWE